MTKTRRIICLKPTFMSPAISFKLEAQVKECHIELSLDPSSETTCRCLEVPSRHSTDRWVHRLDTGCVSDAYCHRWVTAPRDTEAEVQSSIAVCECIMASQRHGA